MLSGLFFLQFLLLFPMAIEVVEDALAGKVAQNSFLLRFALLVVAFAVIIISKLNAQRRRELIESEILSIHSCAIIWQAVVLAHFLAVRSTVNYSHYTEALAQQATKIAKDPFSIHIYIRSGTVSSPDAGAPNTAAQADSSAAA
jgi:hypothetical protein